MNVTVPNLVGNGIGKSGAEEILAKLQLRHIEKQVTQSQPTGLVIAQDPPAGTEVKQFSVVTITLSSIYDLDLGLQGPQPNGNIEGKITGVTVSRHGAFVDIALDPDIPDFSYSLYLDPDATDAGLPRAEWMRRGAMLGMAQRALASNHPVRLVVDVKIVEKISVSR